MSDTSKHMVCDRHGEFKSIRSTWTTCGKERESWSSCPDCEAERAHRAAEEDARRRRREHEQRLERAAVPPRFVGRSFDDYHASTAAQRHVLAVCRDYADRFAEHLDVGRCLVMSGGVGCGKTHLALAVVQQLIEHRFPHRDGWADRIGYSVRYATAFGFVRSVRATWRDHSPEAEEIGRFARPDLLVLDEVGAGPGSDSERAMFGELIDLRYGAQLPTLVITNCDRAGLIHNLGERAVDRLRDNGGLMAMCDWPSYRGNAPELRNVGTREIDGGQLQ